MHEWVLPCYYDDAMVLLLLLLLLIVLPNLLRFSLVLTMWWPLDKDVLFCYAHGWMDRWMGGDVTP